MLNKLSQIYWPLSIVPKDAIVKSSEITSRSQKLLLDNGLIKGTGSGSFYFLPILQKALDKCIRLVNYHMESINAQKVTLPVLTSTLLWKKSGRLNSAVGELLIVKDKQGKEHILSPTHEEAITDLIAMSAPVSYKHLPLRLYQIGPKFRDEIKPRFGLIRTKEFIMKDLYTFDSDLKNSRKTYEEVQRAYEQIFNCLEIPWLCVEGNTGEIGGQISQEFHVPSNIGEDNLVVCESCNFSSNKELCGEIESCPSCNSKSALKVTKGIEIAHTFLLGDKYSKPLQATYLKSNGKTENLSMGCYGVGVTRLLGASLEVLSSENQLRWPSAIAPYDLCIITPKEGSKEENLGNKWLPEIYKGVTDELGKDSVLLDDRMAFTIGRRLFDIKKLGIPLVIIIGSKVKEDIPIFELYFANTDTSKFLQLNELLKEISEFSKGSISLKKKFHAI